MLAQLGELRVRLEFVFILWCFLTIGTLSDIKESNRVLYALEVVIFAGVVAVKHVLDAVADFVLARVVRQVCDVLIVGFGVCVIDSLVAHNTLVVDSSNATSVVSAVFQRIVELWVVALLNRIREPFHDILVID